MPSANLDLLNSVLLKGIQAKKDQLEILSPSFNHVKLPCFYLLEGLGEKSFEHSPLEIPFVDRFLHQRPPSLLVRFLKLQDLVTELLKRPLLVLSCTTQRPNRVTTTQDPCDPFLDSPTVLLVDLTESSLDLVTSDAPLSLML